MLADPLRHQRARVCSLLRSALSPYGLDVVIPLTLEKYNAFLGDAALERFQLQPPPASGAQHEGSEHLMVLLGNSKALWTPFVKFAEREMDERGGDIADDPIDRYIKQSVSAALEQATVSPANVYWVADMQPGKMILAQKMALVARAASHCPASQLCLHPTLGPWLAFRCAMVFPIEPSSDYDTEEIDDEQVIEEQPPLCSHDEKLHEVLKKQMDKAFAQSAAAKPRDLTPGRIPADAWRAWALPRLTLAPNHPAMYPAEQILYHYTKDVAFLAQIIAAKRENRSIDYLREPAPSSAVLECRRLIQQVLSEIAESSEDANIDGILLSGGLDTSILAEATAQPFEPPFYSISLDKRDSDGNPRPILRFRHGFTVQAHEEALDAQYASGIFDRLRGVSLGELHILKRSLDDIVAPESIRAVSKLLQSFDPMELRNSLVVYAALLEAKSRGVRRIVTGDGADEIFCGYSFYHSMSEEKLRAYRDQIATVMNFTASALAASLGIEVISPFLDKRVVEFASRLEKKDLVGERTPVPLEGEGGFHGKLVLRQAFPEAFSQWRSKQPIESGAGSTALRLGFFDDICSDSELQARKVRAFHDHGIVLRDREHSVYFDAFLAAYDGDLGNVPKRRRSQCVSDEGSNGFCPACGFELSHPAQDFCVTCGFWPARANDANNREGLATRALMQLEREKAVLRDQRAQI